MDILSLILNSGFLKPILWLIGIFGMIICGIGALYLAKQRKLEYGCLILSQVGDRKLSVLLSKAGWFKNHNIFKLWYYGTEEKIRTKDGRVIYGLTRSDMHFFKGKRCIICIEKGDDKKVLTPVKWVDLDERSRKILMAVAPVDLRDVSSQIIAKNAMELKSNMLQYAQIAMLAGIVIFAIIGIILITQMVNNGQAESKDLILQSMQFSCDQARTAVASLAP